MFDAKKNSRTLDDEAAAGGLGGGAGIGGKGFTFNLNGYPQGESNANVEGAVAAGMSQFPNPIPPSHDEGATQSVLGMGMSTAASMMEMLTGAFSMGTKGVD